MHEWSFDVPLPIFWFLLLPIQDGCHCMIEFNIRPQWEIVFLTWWYMCDGIFNVRFMQLLSQVFCWVFFYCVFFCFLFLFFWCHNTKYIASQCGNITGNKLFPVGFSKKTLKLGSLQTIYYCVNTFKLLINSFFFIYDVKIKCIQ
jgi:hypothetical protein